MYFVDAVGPEAVSGDAHTMLVLLRNELVPVVLRTRQAAPVAASPDASLAALLDGSPASTSVLSDEHKIHPEILLPQMEALEILVLEVPAPVLSEEERVKLVRDDVVAHYTATALVPGYFPLQKEVARLITETSVRLLDSQLKRKRALIDEIYTRFKDENKKTRKVAK